MIRRAREVFSLVLESMRSRTPFTARREAFTTASFRRRERFRNNYTELCGALHTVLNGEFSQALDVGSANGFVIDAMVALGIEVQGIELSPDVRPLLTEQALHRTRFADATAVGKLGDFDLVTCIEVAEHVPPERSEALMDVLSLNASRWLYFTAATPYQPGHGHINCRPHFFCSKGLRDRGFDLDYDRTDQFVELIRDLEPCAWLPLNSLLFHRRTML